MGIFDRLRKSGSQEAGGNSRGKEKAAKKDDSFFLDSDSSSSLGDRNYMREAKTIRRTFPGSADSPGNKELVTEVDAMGLKVEAMTEGLGGSTVQDDVTSVTGGVPKPVKKTFAEAMSKQELQQRMKGSAINGTNTRASADAAPAARKAELKPETTTTATSQKAAKSSRPGSIDPFMSMAQNLDT